jgi:hypothetical protein
MSGNIVCAGNHATDEAIMTWAKKFARYHPQVSIRPRDDTHHTTDAFDVAIAAGDIDLIPSASDRVLRVVGPERAPDEMADPTRKPSRSAARWKAASI